ncbi:hypothetical protein J4N46_12050 [Capnocytophaga sp. Marseille-Q4570]|uniref:Uncharacterized protein n=1 Tax=Capnocytophaga bilenii TaxID=2819369 RepID=A0ABS3Q1J8_9FLAO|nr:hypothetical protein [Capnocytophaga bilenii]MBO1885123.1 hypothetical protein [Capnocytophaga bilenii]
MYQHLGNIFIKYDKITIRDFLLSPIWVEYYQSYELDIFRRNGATEEWIEKNIFEYEEKTKGNGKIFYVVIGESYYKNREYVYIKNTMVFNAKYFFNAYSTLIRDEILETKAIDFYINKKNKTLFYLQDLWKNENQRTIKSIANYLNEEIELINIYTDQKFSDFIDPSICFYKKHSLT